MLDSKHDSNHPEPFGFRALPANLVEGARSGDRTAFVHVLEYAREGNTEAIAFLMERCQIHRDSTACAFLQGRLQRNDPSVLASLVEKAQQGDKLAFACLYEHYFPAIHRYLTLHIGEDSEIARDLTQDTFLKVLLNIPKSRPDTKVKFRPWLYKIAENVLKDYYEKQKRCEEQPLEMVHDDEVVVLPDIQNKLSTRDSPEEIVAGVEHIRLALNEVGPQNRVALLKQAFQPGSQRDMADSLNINEGTFSGYVSRGRAEFEKAYERISKELEPLQGEEEQHYE